MSKYILAIDQGTTGTTTLVVSKEGKIVSKGYKEITQHYPEPSWVEHDPIEIFESVLGTIKEALAKAQLSYSDIASIGITNQRETTVVWERSSGKPICNAIVWQCRRSAEICEQLKKDSLQDFFYNRTGLTIDAYFSGTKIKWIMENVKPAKKLAANGELLFGTIDTWILWNLTGRKIHATDMTNASRTLLFNIHKKCWDEELIKILNLPEDIFPRVCDSSFFYGETDEELTGGQKIPITGIAGDQQAALFGQCCFSEGDIKTSYGTGAFLVMYTGEKPKGEKDQNILTTLCCDPEGKVAYALEGSIFMCGAILQWLRDELGIIKDSADSEDIANSISDTKGVYFVPAFTGLGAPYWDMYARGAILGLTRGASKKEIVRAALESIAFQTKELLDSICDYSGFKAKSMKVDGGACANNFLMQFSSDILEIDMIRPNYLETTALGVAYLAGLNIKFWKNAEALKKLNEIETRFDPKMLKDKREELFKGWKAAVKKVRHV
ncbi:MAG: glycerol kinase GlpK [Pseudomonadota bacterium]